MKKIILFSIISCMMMGLQGCTEQKDSLSEVSQDYPWAIATDSPKDTVTSLYAHKFADEIERISEGKIKIEVYENGTLGGDRELIESCMGKDIPFVIQNTAPQVSFMPELAVFDLPLAYTSIEDLRTTLDNEEFYMLINQVYNKRGFRLLGIADQGFRVMTTNKEIITIDDFASQKIRTMENPYHVAFWKAINANPTPMTFSEVYIGLQQGTIDAQENPYEVIVSGKIYEQQDYIVETNHLPHLLSLYMNDEFYQQLSEEEKEIVKEAAATAKQYAREQANERVANRLDIITDSGTQMIKLKEDMIDEMRNKASIVYDDIKERIGDDLYNAYLKIDETSEDVK